MSVSFHIFSSVPLSLSLPPSLLSSLSPSVRLSLLFFSFSKLLTWVKNIQMKRSWRRPWANIINLFPCSPVPTSLFPFTTHFYTFSFFYLSSHLAPLSFSIPARETTFVSHSYLHFECVFFFCMSSSCCSCCCCSLLLLLLLLIFWADMKLLQNKCKLNFSCIICLEVLQHPKMRCDASIFLVSLSALTWTLMYYTSFGFSFGFWFLVLFAQVYRIVLWILMRSPNDACANRMKM